MQPLSIALAGTLWLLVCLPGAAGEIPEGTRGIRVTPLSPEQFASVGFTAADSVGLFVGVRSFVNFDGKASSRLAGIPYAVDDAVDLAHVFSLELKLVPPDRVTLALSGTPQKPRSQESLKQLLEAGARQTNARFTTLLGLIEQTRKGAGPNGLAILTFATHGYTSAGTFRILGEDSSPTALDLTGLPVERITDVTATATAPRQLLLIDACRERIAATRAVGADPGTALTKEFARALHDATGTAVLCATTAGGYSYDDSTRENGVFTAAIIEGLRGAAGSDPRGFVTPSTLAEFVDREVRTWVSKNRPEHVTVSRGISYTTDDLRSGGMPLAVNAEALVRVQRASLRRDRLLAVVRSSADTRHVTEIMVEEIAQALQEKDSVTVAPLLERLGHLETLGTSYVEDFAYWWTGRGRREVYGGKDTRTPDVTTTAPLVRLATDDGRETFEDGEAFRVQMTASEGGHATVVVLDAEGTATLLFPNHFRPDSRVRGGETTVFNLRAAPPHGVTRILALWTRSALRLDGVSQDDIRDNKGACPLPTGLATRAAFAESEADDWLSLEDFVKSLDASTGGSTELRITTTGGPAKNR